MFPFFPPMPPFGTGNTFPYTNFHDMNLDWIIKVVWQFYQDYNNIQSQIQTATDESIEDIHTAETEAVNSVNAQATQIINNLIATIPADYSTFVSKFNGFINEFNLTSWVNDKFINPSDGVETTDSRYVHSIMFPKSYLEYIYNWDASKTTSYVSLYNNGTYVGYMSGTIDDPREYDSVILNVFKTDYPDYSKTLEILNWDAISQKLEELQKAYTYIPEYRSGIYDQNTGNYRNPAQTNYICTTTPIPANIENLMIL